MPAIYSDAKLDIGSDINLYREAIIRPDSRKWKHILLGDRKDGGHFSEAPKKNKTKFPSWWDEKQVVEAMEATLKHGRAEAGAHGEIDIFRLYKGVLVQVKVRDSKVGTVFPVRGDGVYFVDRDSKKHRRTPPNDSFEAYPDVYGRNFY